MSPRGVLGNSSKCWHGLAGRSPWPPCEHALAGERAGRPAWQPTCPFPAVLLRGDAPHLRAAWSAARPVDRCASRRPRLPFPFPRPSADDISEDDLRDQFYLHGELRSVKKVASRNCAFVTYATRAGAEKAADELANK